MSTAALQLIYDMNDKYLLVDIQTSFELKNSGTLLKRSCFDSDAREGVRRTRRGFLRSFKNLLAFDEQLRLFSIARW